MKYDDCQNRSKTSVTVSKWNHKMLSTYLEPIIYKAIVKKVQQLWHSKLLEQLLAQIRLHFGFYLARERWYQSSPIEKQVSLFDREQDSKVLIEVFMFLLFLAWSQVQNIFQRELKILQWNRKCSNQLFRQTEVQKGPSWHIMVLD